MGKGRGNERVKSHSWYPETGGGEAAVREPPGPLQQRQLVMQGESLV